MMCLRLPLVEGRINAVLLLLLFCSAHTEAFRLKFWHAFHLVAMAGMLVRLHVFSSGTHEPFDTKHELQDFIIAVLGEEKDDHRRICACRLTN